jgi:hypothetical protein
MESTEARKHGEHRYEQEDGTLRECIAHGARHHGDRDIARMVEGSIPPQAPGQLLPRIQA